MRQNNINCTHYFSTYQIFFTFSCGEFFPHDNLSCGEFLHLTICHVDKFLHMTEFFSTSTARGAPDKYDVCLLVAKIKVQPPPSGLPLFSNFYRLKSLWPCQKFDLFHLFWSDIKTDFISEGCETQAFHLQRRMGWRGKHSIFSPWKTI